MRKTILKISIVAVLSIFLCPVVKGEEITLMSYYPSPIGVYRETRIGAIDHFLTINYDSTNTCHLISASGNNDDIKLSHDGSANDLVIDTSGSVGIGTNSPNAALQVIGAITREGTTLNGSNPATHVNLGINSTTGGDYPTIDGGIGNYIFNPDGGYSTISGGHDNAAYGKGGVIGGGGNNSTGVSEQGGIISPEYATIPGGYGNIVKGSYSVACGGRNNTVCSEYSWAGGRNAYVYANHHGSFVWNGVSDSAATGSSNNPYTFNIYATNGIYFGTSRIHDVAEFMDVLKEEDVEEGHIVSIKAPAKLGKSTTAYDEMLIGVVSGKRTCTFHMGSNTPGFDDTIRLPIALVGMVYVKVNNENGPIRLGDAITSSSAPGIGMRATRPGKIIGYAMEETDFSKEDIKEMLVFVNLTYYIPKGFFNK